MFKLIKVSVLLISIIFAEQVLASPFIISDPQLKSNITKYIVTLDGVDTTVDPDIVDDTNVRLKYDLPSSINNGSHIVSVKSVNIWGLSKEVNFSFTKEVPVIPSNIQIIP